MEQSAAKHAANLEVRTGLAGAGGGRQRLGAIETDQAPRAKSGMPELDRVLGGGLVHGSVVLVGGSRGLVNRPCFYKRLRDFVDRDCPHCT